MNKLNRLEKIICSGVILTSIRPEGISEIYPQLYSIIYVYGFYFSCLIAIFLFIIAIGKRKNVSNFMIIFFVFIGFMFFSTFLNDGPVHTCLNMWVRPITILLVFEVYRNKIIDLLHIFEWVLLILVILNLGYMLQYPQGMYVMEGTNYTNCWLLGYKSSFQYYFLPLITVTLIFRHYQNENLFFRLSLLLVHIESILALNVMFIVVLVIFDIFFFFKLVNRVNIFNAKTYLIVIVVANVIFAFFLSVLINWRPIYYFFNNILGKNTTLFIRMNAWSQSIQFIQEKFLAGWGYTTGTEMKKIFGFSIIHLHNQCLMLFLQVGILGTVIFGLLMIEVVRKLNINKEAYAAKVISLSIFCLFISVLVEIFLTGTSVCIWPVIYSGYFCKEIDLFDYKKKWIIKRIRLVR